MNLNNSVSNASASHNMNGGNNVKTVGIEHSSETLRYQTMSFELNLEDNRGRSVSVSYSTQQLDYSRTYDRFGAVSGAAESRDPINGFFDQVRSIASKNISEQGRALIEHQQEKLSLQTSSLKIEGDVSLLKDYFSSTNTADRIMNFVDRIGAAVEKLDPGINAGFKDFMSQIRSGIAEGFAQAEQMLGGLPEISLETQDILELLLNQYQKDPQDLPQAADYLEEVRERRSQARLSNNS